MAGSRGNTSRRQAGAGAILLANSRRSVVLVMLVARGAQCGGARSCRCCCRRPRACGRVRRLSACARVAGGGGSRAAGGARQEQATPEAGAPPAATARALQTAGHSNISCRPAKQEQRFSWSKHTHTVKTFDKVSLLLVASARTTA